MKKIPQILTLFLLIVAVFALFSPSAWAFCGFYVAKADARLYNQASQVIIARDGNRTVLTMANDYKGEVEDFALVVPVPVVLTEEQVRVAEPKIIERIDAFSAPRLVEYFDDNPCMFYPGGGTRGGGDVFLQSAPEAIARSDKTLGVTVESRFTVGEYDIIILSAKESDGLETWLVQNGYKIPSGASQLLQPYIRQNLKFFVAKVNLTEFDKGGFQSLRPLMMAYESPKFMLPIRLGMMNATGEQDLIVYLLSPQGQTEITNYRTVKIPSNVDIPEFIQNKFAEFYQAMFKTAYEREQKRVAFLEYAWDMQGCDPCAADPLTPEELKQAGVFWLNPGQPTNVFISRVHVRYTRETFPEDLQFQETGNRQLFQGRYVINHPYKGEITCDIAEAYKESVQERQQQEIENLARLTNWNINDIRRQANLPPVEEEPWWRRLWN
ncbi:DUF2330 domain-containing protein [Capilliphycus salinus ALCB114379]|uniref:DUF2330 domain-containing protein n=1 Tax=Capilliphycus salinus TaxID=2768948 RepID=UPI0039A49002